MPTQVVCCSRPPHSSRSSGRRLTWAANNALLPGRRRTPSCRTRARPGPQIGPGTGNLTKHLLQRGAHVTAVEKDDTLFLRLREQYEEVSSCGAARGVELPACLPWPRAAVQQLAPGGLSLAWMDGMRGYAAKASAAE